MYYFTIYYTYHLYIQILNINDKPNNCLFICLLNVNFIADSTTVYYLRWFTNIFGVVTNLLNNVIAKNVDAVVIKGIIIILFRAFITSEN
jgi:hypothetical protein